MTQNKDTPKEIWIDNDETNYYWDKPCENNCPVNPTKYIRADLVPQWQPIDTAPKDGTEIILGITLNWGNESKEEDEPRVGKGFYICGGYWYDNTTNVWKNRISNFLKTPTHWMPLPKPPESLEPLAYAERRQKKREAKKIREPEKALLNHALLEQHYGKEKIVYNNE